LGNAANGEFEDCALASADPDLNTRPTNEDARGAFNDGNSRVRGGFSGYSGGTKTEVSATKLSQLVLNKSSYADVKALLGKPTSEAPTPDGILVTYGSAQFETKMDPRFYIPLVGQFIGRAKSNIST
jgi:hypothetical protein